MKDDDDNNDGKVDFLAKYRGGEAELVTNAQMLTFCPRHPKNIDGTAFTHVSFSYALLNRVDYFNGRINGNVREEIIHLVFHEGDVMVYGISLGNLHKRIMRREVDFIPAVPIEESELEMLRKQEDVKATVFHLVITLTDDPNENARYPDDENDESNDLLSQLSQDAPSDE